ncbi:hypothetical protein ACFL0Y_01970 [Patescibacteria group bacterium]
MPEEVSTVEQNINQTTPPEKTLSRSKKFTRTEDAIKFLKVADNSRVEYSLDTASSEKPLMHYTHGGNLLQILRFGLQSNNFKNQLSEHRASDPELDVIANQISGFRFKQGASYQGKDSISMSLWNENMFAGPGNVLLLVNPDTQVWGLEGPREATGYGHGIKVQKVEGDYEVGNATAYSDEVAACNIIPPVDIRAIVVDKWARILRDMSLIIHEQAKIYSQEKQRDPRRANEDMLANVRLLAALNNDEELQQRADAMEERLPQLAYRDVAMEVIALQKSGLQKFIGNRDLNEDNLRQAISERFNIKILEKS